MTSSGHSAPPPRSPFAALREGFRVGPLTVLLIAAIDTGIAALLWIGDPRPFWHPLLTAQINGFVIAYAVNVAAPWDRRWPILRLILGVVIGSIVALLLVIV